MTVTPPTCGEHKLVTGGTLRASPPAPPRPTTHDSSWRAFIDLNCEGSKMPRVYTMLLKVTRIRLRIIATDCTWSTSVDVEVLIFRKQAQVSVTLVKVLLQYETTHHN